MKRSTFLLTLLSPLILLFRKEKKKEWMDLPHYNWKNSDVGLDSWQIINWSPAGYSDHVIGVCALHNTKISVPKKYIDGTIRFPHSIEDHGRIFHFISEKEIIVESYLRSRLPLLT